MSFNNLLFTKKSTLVLKGESFESEVIYDVNKVTKESLISEFIRNASKKTGGSTQNTNTKVKPKHRGWKVQDGHYVQAGHSLATQRTLRFHPGLNVGFGRNGTLFAMVPGKVVVTCEKFDPDWHHTWVQRHYSARRDQTILKKYFNVIPQPQHQRFKLIDEV